MSLFCELTKDKSNLCFSVQFSEGDINLDSGGKVCMCNGYHKLVQDVDRYLKTAYDQETNEGNRIYSTLHILDQFSEKSALNLIESDFRDALIRLKAQQKTNCSQDERLRSIEKVVARYDANDLTTVLVDMLLLNGLNLPIKGSVQLKINELTIRHLYWEI